MDDSVSNLLLQVADSDCLTETMEYSYYARRHVGAASIATKNSLDCQSLPSEIDVIGMVANGVTITNVADLNASLSNTRTGCLYTSSRGRWASEQLQTIITPMGSVDRAVGLDSLVGVTLPGGGVWWNTQLCEVLGSVA